MKRKFDKRMNGRPGVRSERVKLILSMTIRHLSAAVPTSIGILVDILHSSRYRSPDFNGIPLHHLSDLLHCTNEPNVSIPQLANLLIERTQNGSWIVVFKSLVTVHHLMCYGSERFTQYLASSNCTFNLANFNDRLGTPQVSSRWY